MPSATDPFVATLLRIPALLRDLDITISRTDQVASAGVRVSSGDDEQPMPYNVAASTARLDLERTLRQLRLAWLIPNRRQHITVDRVILAVQRRTYTSNPKVRLGFCERQLVVDAVAKANRARDVPTSKSKPAVQLTNSQIDRARGRLLDAVQIARLLSMYMQDELKPSTVRSWASRGHIASREINGRRLYRVGDVLDYYQNARAALVAELL